MLKFFFCFLNLVTSVTTKQAKDSSNARSTNTTSSSSSSTCTNSYGGAYANWWTYSVLLINWFILFSFILYLINRFNIGKRTVIVTVSIAILSFMMIIAFAILWGVQCM